MTQAPPSVATDLAGDLLLQFHRDPQRYRSHMRHADHLLDRPELILRLALRRSVAFGGMELNRPGVAAELEQAARLFIREVFFRAGADYYRVLGLKRGADATAIRDHYRLLMKLTHPDRELAHSVWPADAAARINRAYTTLKHPDSRLAYDRQLDAPRDRVPRPAQSQAPSHASPPSMPIAAGRAPQKPIFPEWLTAGVGGFMWRHPAIVAFTALIALALGGVGLVVQSELRGSLVRGIPEGEQIASDRVAPAGASLVPQANDPPPGTLAPPNSHVASDIPRTGPGNVSARPAGSDRRPDLPTPAAVVAVPVPPGSNPTAAPESPPSQDAPSIPGPSSRPVLASVPPVVQGRDGEVRGTPLPLAAATLGNQAPASPTTGSPPVTPTIAGPIASPVARSNIGTEATAPPASLPRAGGRGEPEGLVARPPAAPAVRPVLVGDATPTPLPPSPTAPKGGEIEVLLATFLTSYESGQVDTMAGLFAEDAMTDRSRGRAAIRGEYAELFERSNSRRISLSQFRWAAIGDHVTAAGQVAVRVAWRDGREVEERLAVDMDLVRRNGRTQIARFSYRPLN